MVEWATGVNKRVLRSGTSWNNINAVLEDATKSGKPKRRLYGSFEKKSFNIAMRFTLAEYTMFKAWYEDKTYYGLNSFGFPQIDDNTSLEKEYRFKAGSAPQCQNQHGNYVDVTMVWEEV